MWRALYKTAVPDTQEVTDKVLKISESVQVPGAYDVHMTVNGHDGLRIRGVTREQIFQFYESEHGLKTMF